MIKLSYDGYVFISDSGIEYCLLEGVSIGHLETYTSDTIFIMMDDYRYECSNPFVGFLRGATFLAEHQEEYNKQIQYLVNIYESTSNLIKKGE